MKRPSTRTVSTLAIVTAEICLINAITTVPVDSSSPLYSIANDIVVAVEAMCSAVLAWLFFSALGAPLSAPVRARASLACLIGLASALAGALIVTAGAALDILRLIDWEQAGLLVVVGNAFIGLWLALANTSALRQRAFPRKIALYGLLAGLVMAAGFLAAPSLLARIEDASALSWFTQLGNLGGFGWFFLYPVWAVWLGLHLRPKDPDASPVFPNVA